MPQFESRSSFMFLLLRICIDRQTEAIHVTLHLNVVLTSAYPFVQVRNKDMTEL